MIKKLLAFLCLCSSAWATTTVSGNIKNLGTGAVSTGSFVRFYLRGCSGNQPRINGTALIAPTLGNVFYFDFVPNSSGAITGTLYSTRDSTGLLGGDIECGGSTTAVWYGMVAFLNGKAGPETPIHAKNTATIDISNITAITANPVITAPTGDSTYLRLDAGNGPLSASLAGPFNVNGAGSFTGALTTGTINSVCIAAQQAGADIGAQINNCLTSLPANGGIIQLPNSVTCFSQTTAVTINKPAYLIGHGAGASDALNTVPADLPATCLKWTGTAGATMITFTASGQSSGGPLDGAGMSQIKLDGNAGNAATLLTLQSVENFALTNFYFTCGSSQAIKFDVLGSVSGFVSNGPGLIQNGSIREVDTGCASGIGMNFTSSNAPNDTDNFTVNAVRFQYKNGNGITITDSDTNTFINVLESRASGGTGLGVSVNESTGHLARDIYFYSLDPGTGGVTQSGTSSDVHFWNYYNISAGNAAPAPTISSGNSTIFYSGGNNAGGAQTLGAITANALFINQSNGGLPTSCTGATAGQVTLSCIASIFGTSDQIIQSSPAAATGWSVIEDNGTLGLGLSTATAKPISVRPNRVQTVSFPAGAGAGINVFGSSSGSTNINAAATASGTVTLPAATGTALLATEQNCGTAAACSATNETPIKIVRGNVPLTSASPSTVTVTGISPAFTSSTSYTCTATPTGATAAIAAGGIAITYVSGSSFTLTGPNTVTTVIQYICIGT